MMSDRACLTSTLAILAILSAGVIAGGGSRAQDAPRRAVLPSAVAGQPTKSSGSELTVGDRLKVTFFEHLDLSATSGGNRGDASAPAAVQTFYQRMDLSGDYTVQQDGSISLPLLGRSVADGKNPADVQSDLAIAFARTMGRPAEVNVAIAERAPIYIVGPVRQPGAYKFVPGMMVLQVLALAGGVDRSLSGASQLIEGVREMERIRKTADQMKRLLARRARLQAELGGTSELKPPETLVALAGERANAFIDVENAMLRVELDQKQQQRREAAAAVTAAQRELSALHRKLAQLEAQKSIRDERLADLQKLMTKGFTTRNGLIVVRSELSDIEARREDINLAITQVEARLATAERAAARQDSERSAKLLRTIASTDDEILDMQQTLTSTTVLRAVIEESTSKLAATGTASTPQFQIVRRSRSGPSVFAAEETSTLLPGDVLKVIIPPQASQWGTKPAQADRIKAQRGVSLEADPTP